MKQTYEEYTRIAVEQSARDFGCDPEAFGADENRFLVSALAEGARVYCRRPVLFEMATYGKNTVAAGREDLIAAAREALGDCEAPYGPFCPENLAELDRQLRQRGAKLGYASHYFLPDPAAAAAFDIPCPFPVRLLEPAEFAALYVPEFPNALSAKRPECDRLACAAYDGDRVIALAGISEDCPSMWQIGIDVLPAYRGHGIGPCLVNRLTREVLSRGSLPFYGAAWANVRSMKTAERAGYRMAWTQVAAVPLA
ncbi:MAG: GNAT family N-acetyltransferase [Clostridia bacterium]|nr:GNAT family N-acetyltransferase [Clostridia bacterium]